LGLFEFIGGVSGGNDSAVRIIDGFPGGSLVFDLNLDPIASLLQTVGQRDGRSPTQDLFDQSVVTVSSANSFRSRNMFDGDVFSSEAEGEFGHIVHRDHLVGAEVEGLRVIGTHDPQDSFDAVVDETERSGLKTISPHLELFFGDEGFSAEGSRGLLSPSLPGSLWAIDVMEPGDSNLDTEVLLVMHGQFLGDEFLETICVLGLGGPSVDLLQSRAILVQLLALGVDASGGGIEEALSFVDACGFEHVEADLGVVVEDDGMVGLDEAHSSHIGGEIEDPVSSFGRFQTVVVSTKVELKELVTKLLFLKIFVADPVDSDDMMTFFLQTLGDVRGDESSSSSDSNSQG